MSDSMRLNAGDLIADGERVPHESLSGTFWTDVLRDGSSLGHTEPLIRTLNTLMTQGAWETLGPFGNRSPSLVIEIEGENADALNAGEVWLSEIMYAGALEWLPPGQTVWTVFDVVWCYIDRSEDERWDFDENVWKRRYRIPLRTLPHARSPQLTVTDAAPSSSTPIVDTQVTAASNTSGFTGRWSRTGFGAGSGSVTVSNAVAGWARASLTTTSKDVGTQLFLAYTFGTPVAAATPYVRIDFRVFGGTFNPQAQPAAPGSWGGGTRQPARSSITDLGGGVFGGTVYYRVPDNTTDIEISASLNSGVTGYLEIDQIRKLSRLPDTGTNRQKSASITPGGSAPAEGSLHVGHTTAGLGRTILYTYPLGRPSPALMQYKTAGTTSTPDSTCINGERTLIQATDLVLTVPDLQLPTRGRAALWAKLQVDTAPATVRWTVTPVSNGSTVGQIQTRDVVVPVGTIVLVPLGLVDLPGAVTGPSGAHTVALRRVAGTGVVSVDEVWPFGMDDESALTIIDAGTGTPASGGISNHVWVNAPTALKPAGEVLIGTNLNDARWPASILAGPAVHKFPSKGVSVLTVTCGATDAATDLTHYKRWTHHAAETS